MLIHLKTTNYQKIVFLLGICLSSVANSMPNPVATYNFENSLAGNEANAPTLTSIDPISQNRFLTDTVFGQTRQVYRFDGNVTSSENAGLYLSTLGILDNDDAYSIEMIFKFEENQSSWENIFGVSNRQSDNAFYVDPSNRLEVWPSGDGPDEFIFDEYHHVTLTNDGAGQVTSYLDGIFQFDLTTASMDFSAYPQENPDRLIHFFADNVAAGGQNEFSDGRVALIRLYDLALTPKDVADLDENPFPAVPIPTAIWLFGSGLLGLIGVSKSKKVTKTNQVRFD